jgi:hypothetical protein
MHCKGTLEFAIVDSAVAEKDHVIAKYATLAVVDNEQTLLTDR